jgi:hypothetical protein
VPFEVSVAPQVIEYLNTRELLTVADRERFIEGIFEELGEGADRFLARNPHPVLPNRFWYDYVLITEAREVREFLFACSAEGHVFGVTEVLYAEERVVDDES